MKLSDFCKMIQLDTFFKHCRNKLLNLYILINSYIERDQAYLHVFYSYLVGPM